MILKLEGEGQIFSEGAGTPLEGLHHTSDVIWFVFLRNHSGEPVGQCNWLAPHGQHETEVLSNSRRKTRLEILVTPSVMSARVLLEETATSIKRCVVFRMTNGGWLLSPGPTLPQSLKPVGIRTYWSSELRCDFSLLFSGPLPPYLAVETIIHLTEKKELQGAAAVFGHPASEAATFTIKKALWSRCSLASGVEGLLDGGDYIWSLDFYSIHKMYFLESALSQHGLGHTGLEVCKLRLHELQVSLCRDLISEQTQCSI